MTGLLVAFLAVHGLLHLAIWVPPPQPQDSAPFRPDHSAVLTAVRTPAVAVRSLARGLALGAAVMYVLAAVGVAVGAGWAAAAALVAALLGLLLKGLYFHPWLLLGIALDGLVFAAVMTGWPVNVG
jgi:hypothetical protein